MAAERQHMPEELKAIIALLEDGTIKKMMYRLNNNGCDQIAADIWNQVYETHQHLGDLWVTVLEKNQHPRRQGSGARK